MLGKLMIAAALLTASGAALADSAYVYGGVASVDPSFAISYGTGPYGGINLMYSSGGVPYWGAMPYRPAPVVVVPAPYYPAPYYRVPPPPPRYGYGHGYGPGWKGKYYGNGHPGPYRYDDHHDHH
jgi:hypothetical protein